MKILKFGALWCPGCLVMRPRFTKIEAMYQDLETEYYEYDQCPEAVAEWDIGRILPVFIFVDKNNQELTRIVGEQKIETITNIIDQYLDKEQT